MLLSDPGVASADTGGLGHPVHGRFGGGLAAVWDTDTGGLGHP